MRIWCLSKMKTKTKNNETIMKWSDKDSIDVYIDGKLLDVKSFNMTTWYDREHLIRFPKFSYHLKVEIKTCDEK